MSFVQKIIDDDFVWTAIAGSLVGRRRQSNTRFININCPLCVLHGHRADRKQRLGIKNNNPGVGFHCFNCGARGAWKPGETLSKSLRQLMEGIGIPEVEIKRINHRAFSYRRMIESSPEAQALVPTSFSLDFPPKSLPPGAKSFDVLAKEGCTDPDFLDVVSYVYSRGEEIAEAATYYWTPHTDDAMNRRAIIPFCRHGEVVGWTGRVIDGTSDRRYFSDVPSDFLFNNHVLDDRDREFVLIMEGPFDAIALDGVATLGAKLNDRQAAWIDGSGKKPIVVPDGDKSGDRLIEVAIKRKWAVAFPRLRSGLQNWWDPEIKDAAKAVEVYGRLYTLCSVLQTATTNKTQINLKRQLLA